MEDGRTGVVSLPYTFRNLPPRTKVELSLNIDTHPNDYLLLKTFYSPLRAYADGSLFFERGQEGGYPAFLKDPPTMLTLIQLPDNTRQLRLEYLSPTQRDRLEAQPLFVGNDLALYTMQYRNDLIAFIFSLGLLFFGVFIILLSVFMMRGIATARPVLWFGLLALSTAVWGIGERNYTLFLIPYPTLLYLMAFSGLYFIPVPLLMYGISTVKPVIKWPLQVTTAVYGICLSAIMALQISGRADLSSFSPQFQIFIMFSFFAFFVNP
jgi:hypothetical protein